MKKTEFDRDISNNQALWVVENMRQSDRDEIWAVNRLTPFEAVSQGLRDSIDKRIVRIGNLPVAVCGVAPLGGEKSNFGVPWLLGTPDIGNAPVSFFRGSRAVVESWHPRFSHLINFVDARNVLSLKWLKWLGFKIHHARKYGVDMLPFHLVEKEF